MKIIHEKLYLQLSNLFFMINKLFIICYYDFHYITNVDI